MDVFKVRNQLISDYASYVKSFINIRDERIHNHVEARFEEGFLWPEPLIQLNPSFEPGESIDELVENGTLHQECGRIFRRDKDPAVGSIGFSLRLHRHQAEAIKCAVTGNNYILTTGTASGKSLAYIVPIVNWVLQRGAGKGIQAIIVYPMNALANSQAGELRKFLYHGYEETQRPVRFARYTGQESDEERKQICNYPPDILITNYVMLELILTRPFEQHLIKAAQGLRFLVLDELHTYRGRQGSDVAMLVRRVRDRLSDEKMQCVGTSATVAGSGSFQQQRLEVAAVARKLFGSDIKPENVIGETLQRTTNERNFWILPIWRNLKNAFWMNGESHPLIFTVSLVIRSRCGLKTPSGFAEKRKRVVWLGPFRKALPGKTVQLILYQR
ncbi:MAG: DEAD/DEAH box helicase [Terriglobia bacterium]